MGYGFKIMAEGDYACFTRPECKVERVSYDVPTPGTLEGMIKSVYWKPSIRYVIDRIIVFNRINFVNIKRNEIKEKVSFSKMRGQMNGQGSDPSIYCDQSRHQRASMILKDVRYGVEFHFEMTGIRSERGDETDDKHAAILSCRLESGKCFRTPCFGCSEFPVKKLSRVEAFPMEEIHPEIRDNEDVDLGYMLYRLNFHDGGQPVNGDWEHPLFSDEADAVYYHPHMKRGIIDVAEYLGGTQDVDSGIM